MIERKPENAAERLKDSLDVSIDNVDVDIGDIDAMIFCSLVSKLRDEMLRCNLTNVAQATNLDSPPTDSYRLHVF